MRDRLSKNSNEICEKIQLLALPEKSALEDDIYHRVPIVECSSLVNRSMRLALVPIFEKFVIKVKKDIIGLVSSLILLSSTDASGIKVNEKILKNKGKPHV